jgi:chemotaxis protein MotB
MISYVDVVTILLVFFITAAFKNVKTPPIETPVYAHPAVVPAKPPEPRAKLLGVQEKLREQGLDPKLGPGGLVISLPQVILFSSGDDQVSPEAFPTLERIAAVIRDVPNNVVLIGHADAVPIHNRRFSSNWDLSMARSRRILDLLTSRYGLPERRLSIASYGPYRPVVSNGTADGRATNRRVEILIQDVTESF